MPDYVEELRILGIAFAAVALAGAVVALAIWSRSPSRRLLPLQRMAHRPWSGGEVLLCFFLLYMAAAFSQMLFESAGFFERMYADEPSESRKSLWSSLLAAPLTVAVIYFALFVVSGTRPKDVGMNCARWRANVLLGYVAWLIATPLVWAVFLFIALLVEPQEHPLSILARDKLTAVEWCLFVFQAVIYAAVTEELLFRGVLQGWLQRAPFVGHAVVAALTMTIAFLSMSDAAPASSKHTAAPPSTHAKPAAALATSAKKGAAAMAGRLHMQAKTATAPGQAKGKAPLNWSLNVGLAVFVSLLVPPYLWWAWRVTRRQGQLETEFADLAPELKRRSREYQRVSRLVQRQGAGVAVLGSAMIFAAPHHVWPAQLPLLLLGLVLGWLMVRTQSLVAGIVLHALFNSVTCLMLYLTT